jgi:uncharacterized membrane protein YqjE
MAQTENSESPQPAEVGTLMRRIGDGLKTIAEDEVKLARLELMDEIKKPLASAGAIVLGGVIALFGVGLLCATVVVGLEPLVEPLWLRMLIMSAVYFGIGRVVMGVYMKRFQLEATPDLPRTKREAKATVEAVKSEITNDRD